MKVEWTRWAVSQWLDSFEYLEGENPAAARRIAEAIFETVDMLALHPHAGRIGGVDGTREFAVPRSAFIVAYAVDRSKNLLRVLTVYDGRRRWPSAFPKG